MKKTLFFAATIAVCGCIFASPMKSMLASRGGEYADYEKEPPYPLPDGVVAVEYLESDGKSYILTGFTTSRNLLSFAFDVTFSYTNATAINVSPRAFRIQNSSERACAGVEIQTGSKNWIRFYWGGGSFGSAYVNRYDRKIRVQCDMEGNYNIDDGAFVGKVTPNATWSYASKIGLFCYSFTSVSPSVAGVRIHEAILFHPDYFYFHFIPVRFLNEDGIWEGAMYDLISEELYCNQGSGNFIIGPDL